MDGIKILGIVLLVGGMALEFYGHYTYTKESHEAQFGSFKLSIQEK